MKYVHCAGSVLEVRDAGPVRYRMQATEDMPLPIVTHRFMSDDEARALIMELREQGYAGNNVKEGEAG